MFYILEWWPLKTKTCTRATLEFDSREVPGYPKFTLCSPKWVHDVPSEFQGGCRYIVQIVWMYNICLYILYMIFQKNKHHIWTNNSFDRRKLSEFSSCLTLRGGPLYKGGISGCLGNHWRWGGWSWKQTFPRFHGNWFAQRGWGTGAQ